MGKGEVGERLRGKKWSGGKGSVGKSDVGKCGKGERCWEGKVAWGKG